MQVNEWEPHVGNTTVEEQTEVVQALLHAPSDAARRSLLSAYSGSLSQRVSQRCLPACSVVETLRRLSRAWGGHSVAKRC